MARKTKYVPFASVEAAITLAVADEPEIPHVTVNHSRAVVSKHEGEKAIAKLHLTHSLLRDLAASHLTDQDQRLGATGDIFDIDHRCLELYFCEDADEATLKLFECQARLMRHAMRLLKLLKGRCVKVEQADLFPGAGVDDAAR